ncbi:MAG: cytochrome P460 family protein [Deltaproteobacteria bacterium]|nr:cytochrome P460 family protein [Deltaproteobacteria bacterium]
MKRTGMLMWVLLGLFLMVAVTAMADDKKTGEKAMPGADAAALWAYIHGPSPYWNWVHWPDRPGLYKGREPHGALLQTFVNKTAQRGVYGMRGVVDAGGIIVKENYMPGPTLAAITVMYKIKGYNSDKGDWFWVKYGANGKILKSGKPAGCIGCHGAQKMNDFIMTSLIR